MLAVLITVLLFALTSCDKNEDPPAPPAVPETEYTEVDLNNDGGDVIQTIITIKDHGKGTGSITFTKDKTWVAEGRVFVNEGQILTIDPGTILKGKSGQGENASAFIIARGGMINAVGTVNDPIIFTAETDGIYYDKVEGEVVYEDNLPPTTRGLWGGLIILGSASTNNTTAEKSIEGIPTTEPRGLYGGNDDGSSAGTLKYVSIRYGGTDIGEGNEINGLTLGAVGSGTSIDYLEVISNKDDGIEWFGGTVKVNHAVVAFCGDDSFDWDEGYRGGGQYWFGVQDPNTGDRIGEHDGGPKDNEIGEPYSNPNIYNATFIGRGIDKGKRIFTMRDNSAGVYANSIFVNQEKGVDIEWLNGSDCSYDQWAIKDNLEVKNNIFWEVADGTAAAIFTLSGDDDPPVANVNAWKAYFTDAENVVSDPGIGYVISIDGGLNPVPANNVGDDMATPPAGYDNVDFKGAFKPGTNNWAKGWTLLDHAGFLDH